MRFYANENFPLPIVVELRRHGHDVLTTLDVGKSGQAVSDDEVLAFAHSERRAVLTHNRKHFIRLHNSGADHSGIIVCTFDPDFDGQALRIHEVVKAPQPSDRTLLRVNRTAS